MTVSLVEATAAARRIQDCRPDGTRDPGHDGEGDARVSGRVAPPTFAEDADLLAAFVLAGDTERLRAALGNVADGIEEYTGPVRQLAKIARAALAENES